MKLYNVAVPAHHKLPATALIAYGNDAETLRKNALANYNAIRKSSGFSPMRRMPNGTTYELAKCLVP